MTPNSHSTAASEQSEPSAANPAAAAPSPGAKADAPAAGKTDSAHAIVRRNVLWSLGVGLVPVPIIDVLGVGAVQVKMLKELSELYGVKFSEQIAKKIVASLVAAVGSAGLGVALASTFFKFVPLVGTSLGVVSMPIVAGAFTMATGRVFVAHFESGGTILTFNPSAIRDHFRAEFQQAKQIVTQMKKEADAQGPSKTPA